MHFTHDELKMIQMLLNVGWNNTRPLCDNELQQKYERLYGRVGKKLASYESQFGKENDQ
jgi:hypothetical protein